MCAVAPAVRGVLEAISKLSNLGRLQVALLLVNVIASIAVVNVLSHFADFIQLAIGIEFIVFSIVGIVITIAVENEYTFWALLFLQVQLGCFVTASAFIGVLQQEALHIRLLVVLSNWVLLLLFLLLQRSVRKTWGWHAYHVVGGNREYIRLYSSYQRLNAALMLDAFHACFFLSTEEFLQHNVLQHVVVISTAVLTFVSLRVVQLLYRREYWRGILFISIVYIAGLSTYIAAATAHLVSAAKGMKLRTWDGVVLNSPHLWLLMSIQWCTVIVRILTIVAMFHGTRMFGKVGKGFARFFPAGVTQHGMRYLINPEEHFSRMEFASLGLHEGTSASMGPPSGTAAAVNEGGTERFSSRPSMPVVPVQIIDATKRVYGTTNSRTA